MKKIFFIFIGWALLSLQSCDLNEEPVDTADRTAVFGSEGGMQLYTNSFYDILPDTDQGVFAIDNLSDIVARNGVDDLLSPNALTPTTSSGWNWDQLRNINYFIENAEQSPVTNKDHFIGLARFFRALFYFDKIKRFGDVPWVDRTIDFQDSVTLKAERNNRFDVMEKVVEDLDFAIANIELDNDATSTRITKNVARAYKTRICLFEASWRKYHTEDNMQSTADVWYQYVVDAANEITGFSLYEGSSNERSYRDMFITKTPYVIETLLAVTLDSKLQVFSSANRRFISPTYGSRPSLTRDFVNMYLNLDGTAFTDNPDYKTITFADEVKNRDLRLKQTIRVGDYSRTENGVPIISPPNFNQTYTGYQPIKWCYDERFPYDDESLNDNAHILMRWAEILLNKAEAMAELGTLNNNNDWEATIGVIRKRAGITGTAVTTLPNKADPYLLEYYKGKFTNPVLLEVIRERAVEMVFEGLRPDDLRRWKLGELFQTAKMNGIYIPKLGEYDLNEDGIMDVCFYQGAKPTSTNPSISFVDVSTSNATGRIQLSNGTSGEVLWNPGIREWADKKYLFPIPAQDLERNNNLGQNPGW